MLKNKARKGFTLVEVALAVAVGLIIIGGAVLGYNAVKDNASNSNARNRVLSAVTMIEEYSAANAGQYPASLAAGGAFSTMWQAKRPDDKALSPWGGTTGAATGVLESAPVDFGSTTSTVTPSAAIISAYTAGPTLAANMLFATPSVAASKFGAITTTSTSSVVGVKNYIIGIADKAGTPWWDAKGGK